MVPRHEGSMAWEDGVLVGLSIWTVKSPRMEASAKVPSCSPPSSSAH